MGLLALGTPLHWNEGKKLSDHVKEHAIVQLLHSFAEARLRKEDKFLWGDEIEYMMVHMDGGRATLALEEDQVLSRLGDEGENHHLAVKAGVLFHPEYGRYMLEATPLDPYSDSLKDFLYVEENMAKRREIAIAEISDPKVSPLTLTAFPTMGCGDFCTPSARPAGNASKSLFLPDEIINKHVRFPTLTANIRRRRGSKVAINIPLYQDVNTRSTLAVDPSIPIRDTFPFSDMESAHSAAKPGHIYMDAMGFGMGASCLQVTMQLADIYEARYLYDSLVNFAPLSLALTAAAPIFRGHLADQDVRWNVISAAVDCRTPFERDVDPITDHSLYGGHFNTKGIEQKLQRIPKSRYDSVDQYLGDINSENEFGFFKSEFNDISPPINQFAKQSLIDGGMDDQLANHFGHLFIRDPIVIFNEDKNQDDTKCMDHFENIQSTNWQTLRFKIPSQGSGPGSGKPGWRVELRPMEIQLTDFENAAYSVFSILLAKVIVKTHLDWYLPISKVEINMKRAHSRDAINVEKFWFKIPQSGAVLELSMDEIFNGSVEHKWPGYIPMVEEYISETFTTIDSNSRLFAYLELIKGRSNGSIKTMASCIREIVKSHPSYKNDSIITDEVNYSICLFAKNMGEKDPDTLAPIFGENLSKIIAKSI